LPDPRTLRFERRRRIEAPPAAQMPLGLDFDAGAPELSIVMPCLDEAETLATCITKAKRFLAENQVDGEVIVADNGSTDGSQAIARQLDARVIDVPVRGYGAALAAGIAGAQGRYVAMADADDSYDFLALMPFVERLRAGDELVMGNRFQGGILPGAMPPLHRYLGNPVLSFAGRLFFKAPVGDFHCGLRAFRRDAILRLGLVTKATRRGRFYGYILDQGRAAKTVRIKRGPRAGAMMRISPIDRERYNFVFGRRADFQRNELPEMYKAVSRALEKQARKSGDD